MYASAGMIFQSVFWDSFLLEKYPKIFIMGKMVITLEMVHCLIPPVGGLSKGDSDPIITHVM